MKYTIKSIRNSIVYIWGHTHGEQYRDMVLASLRETPSVDQAWAEDENGVKLDV